MAPDKQGVRGFRGWHPLEQLWQDFRYGCRMLAANPGFTLITVISLAIGIGANCAMFSFADALMLRPLPVARPAEVLTVGSASAVEFLSASSIVSSYRDYVDIRDRNKSFDALAAFVSQPVGLTTKPDAPARLRMGTFVSGNFFSVMGVQPDLGRAFRPEEDLVPGRDAVVILGRDLWEQEFGAKRDVLGGRVRINGIEFTVVGVAPAEFTGMNQFVRSSFYAPLMMWPRLVSDPKVHPLEARDIRRLTIKGRLKPAVTMTQAQSELSLIASDLERAYPDTNRNRKLTVRTELQARIAQDPPDAVLVAMLLTIAAAVLFVACANVAGLLTSRAPARAREMALRLAIGAGRTRLLRQLITESLVIAVMGGALGVGVGYGSMRLFRLIQLPTDLPIQLSFQLDRRVLLFSLIVSLASAVLFSLVPAFHATRTDLTTVMKATDSVSAGRRRWGRSLLVGGQVAVSVVVLVVATAMYRNFREQLMGGPGFKTDHLVMMSFDPSLVRYSEPQARKFFEQLAERARAVPGVKSATLSSSVPMSNDSIGATTIVPEGFQFPVGKDSVTVISSMIDEHYFDTMGLTLLGGRAFTANDGADAPRVAVVNEQLAQHYWPGRDPLGKRFRVDNARGPWVEIVGLAKNSKYIFIAEPPTECVYLPYRQKPQRSMTLLAESIADSASLVAPLREMVRGLDANQPIYNVRTMEAFYRMRTINIVNMILGMVGSMGMMGLVLALVGLYGLVAYAASRRTKEIGIRMAIGADRAAVLRMVLKHGVALAVAGLGIGLVASDGARRLMQAGFTGDVERDPVALVLVALAVLAVTFFAAYIPARRASRINPMSALRYE
jgi:predicted permease